MSESTCSQQIIYLFASRQLSPLLKNLTFHFFHCFVYCQKLEWQISSFVFFISRSNIRFFVGYSVAEMATKIRKSERDATSDEKEESKLPMETQKKTMKSFLNKKRQNLTLVSIPMFGNFSNVNIRATTLSKSSPLDPFASTGDGILPSLRRFRSSYFPSCFISIERHSRT